MIIRVFRSNIPVVVPLVLFILQFFGLIAAADIPVVSHVGITVDNSSLHPSASVRALARIEPLKQQGTEIPDTVLDAIDPIPGAVVAANDAIAFQVSSEGEFTLSSVDGRDILYAGSWGFTGLTTLTVDGVAYVFGSDDGVWSDTVSGNGSCVHGVWELDGIAVELSLSPVLNPMSGAFDLLKANYSFTSLDGDSHSISLMKMFDVKAGDNDTALIGAGDLFSLEEREFSGDSVPRYWYSFDEIPSPGTDSILVVGLLEGYGLRRPDRFLISDWNKLSNGAATYRTAQNITDAAIALYWDNLTVSGETPAAISCGVGLGNYSVVSDARTSLTLIAPKRFSALNTSDQRAATVTALVENISTGHLDDLNVELDVSSWLTISGETGQGISDLDKGQLSAFCWDILDDGVLCDEYGSYSLTLDTGNSIYTPLTIDANIFVPEPVSGDELTITGAEMYIDVDPGKGNGTAAEPFDSTFASNSEVLALEYSLESIEAGWHSMYIRAQGSDGLWGAARETRFHVPDPNYEGPILTIDSNLALQGAQHDNIICGLETGDTAAFAIYIDNADSFRSYDIEIVWDAGGLEINETLSGYAIDEGVLHANGVEQDLNAEQNVFASADGGIAEIMVENFSGRFHNSISALGGEAIEAGHGLLYFAAFTVLEDFDPFNDETVSVRVTLADDFGGLTVLPDFEFILRPPDIYNPPSNVTVMDVPADHGHSLDIGWDISPQDALLNGYTVYRSRQPVFGPALDINDLLTLEDIIAAENTGVIRIGSVGPGVGMFRDNTIPFSGVDYYYWVEGGTGFNVARAGVAVQALSVAELPEVFEVGRPFPNPFNASTSIEIILTKSSPVRFAVYDILGRLVAVPCDRVMPAGTQRLVWRGESSDGNPVSAGVYLYRISSGEHMRAGKLSYIK